MFRWLNRRSAHDAARLSAETHSPLNVTPVRPADAVAAAFKSAQADQRSGSPVEEHKASQTAPLMAFYAPGVPRWTPRTYSSAASAGYSKNPVVYRCVRLIAEAAASVPWVLHKGKRELDTHPLLEQLARPNPQLDGTSFMERVYSHLMLAGNAYLEIVLLESEPRELYALRPDRMRVVPGEEGWPQAYEYEVGGRKVVFDQTASDVPPILHLSLFHPTDDHYGMAPIEASLAALDTHNAAAEWNKALLDNSARPSGALVYLDANGGNLTTEQFERLKHELGERFSGVENAGRPLLLEGGLDWKQMGLSPKDMDFIEAKHAASREIALAFGVPPMLLGVPGDATYANYAEANRAFWRQTILPLVGRAGKAIGHWLQPAYGGDLRLGFDADAVEALSVEREHLWARVDAASFLTENEKRQAVGYGDKPPEEREGEVLTAEALAAEGQATGR